MIMPATATVVFGMALALGGTGAAANAPTKKPNTLIRFISEAHDLSQAHPERVKQLQSAWIAWRKSVGGNKQQPEVNPETANNAP